MKNDPIEVFVSYASPDRAYVHALIDILAVLKRIGVVRTWRVDDIQPGEHREAALNEAIENARLVLPLVSSDYLASDDCWQQALRAAARHSAGTAFVAPILVRPCTLENTPFESLVVLPRNLRAISTWTNVDAAWDDVLCDVRSLVGMLASAGLARASDLPRMGDSRDRRMRLDFGRTNVGRPPTSELLAHRIGRMRITSPHALSAFRAGVKLLIEAEHTFSDGPALTKRRCARKHLLEALHAVLLVRLHRAQLSGTPHEAKPSLCFAPYRRAAFFDHDVSDALASAPSISTIVGWYATSSSANHHEFPDAVRMALGIPDSLREHLLWAARMADSNPDDPDNLSDADLLRLEWISKCVLERTALPRPDVDLPSPVADEFPPTPTTIVTDNLPDRTRAVPSVAPQSPVPPSHPPQASFRPSTQEQVASEPLVRDCQSSLITFERESASVAPLNLAPKACGPCPEFTTDLRSAESSENCDGPPLDSSLKTSQERSAPGMASAADPIETLYLNWQAHFDQTQWMRSRPSADPQDASRAVLRQILLMSHDADFHSSKASVDGSFASSPQIPLKTQIARVLMTMAVAPLWITIVIILTPISLFVTTSFNICLCLSCYIDSTSQVFRFQPIESAFALAQDCLFEEPAVPRRMYKAGLNVLYLTLLVPFSALMLLVASAMAMLRLLRVPLIVVKTVVVVIRLACTPLEGIIWPERFIPRRERAPL